MTKQVEILAEFRIISLAILFVGHSYGCYVQAEVQPVPGTTTRQLESAEITESSGIVAARKGRNWLITHNDSGDKARLFAFDPHGRDAGTWSVPDLQPLDWEDIACVRWQEQDALILADTGDNQLSRSTYQLHILSEPRSAQRPIELLATINFRYADGPHDCEAIAIDESRRAVLFVAKQWPFQSKVYEMPLDTDLPVDRVRVAKPYAHIPAPFVTGIDISASRDRLAVVNYASVYLYERAEDETWQTALRKSPQQVAVPSRRQGEAVCFSLDGRSLFLTSEGLPTPLIQVLLPEKNNAKQHISEKQGE